MIKSIRLINFFSFNDCKIELDANENVLVGINGVGKSNLFKAIKLLKEGVTGKGGFIELIVRTWGGFDAVYNYSNNENRDITIEYEFDCNVLKKYGFQFTFNVFYKLTIKKAPSNLNFSIDEYIYQPKDDLREPWIYLDMSNGNGKAFETQTDIAEIRKNGRLVRYRDLDPQSSALYKDITDPDRYFALSTLRKAIDDISVYDYFDTTPISKMRKPVLWTSENKLSNDGSNLPLVLNTIKLNNKDNYKEIKRLLGRISESYTDIDFNIIGGNIELGIEEQHLNKSIYVTHLSDGTLRFLCLLSILYNKNRGSLICIDEPEVGLHPDMIRTIANSINQASKSSQLLIATHSENLLNQFELEQVKVFEKDSSNSTIVNSFSKETFKDWYEIFSVGKMWRNGDLGGNRF